MVLFKDMYNKVIIFLAQYLVIAEGLVLLILSLQEDSLLKKVSIVFTGGALLILSVATTKILKYLIHKSRPPKDQELFTPFDTYAFPSGHATGLASVTTYITLNSSTLGLIAAGITLIIVYARVKARVHDTYDIIAGIIVGVVVTYLMINYTTNYVMGYFVPTLLG